MSGFFPESSLALKRPLPLLPACGRCGLHKSCRSPKMPVHGEGRRKVLVVGEAPGGTEDEQGRPFVGKAGRYLRSLLPDDVDLDRDCWVTNALACRPPANATPTPEQVEACRPAVFKALRDLGPETVILLGGPAVRSVIGQLWGKGDPGGAGRWAGWVVPNREPDCWLCPTYHPSYAMRSDEVGDPVPSLLLRRHLAAAFALEGRPWGGAAPDYRDQVEVILDPGKAARRLRRFCKKTTPVAFDYEAEAIKPDGPKLRIACAAVSDGEETVAFPWHGEAAEAAREFLRSPVPKVASNLQYEERWTLAKLGCPVRNWHHDTMLAAHLLDNRPGVAGLKFQAFALLGWPSYDDHVHPYLVSPGSNEPNKVFECDVWDLCLYCGLDAVLEVLVFRKQDGLVRPQAKGGVAC